VLSPGPILWRVRKGDVRSSFVIGICASTSRKSSRKAILGAAARQKGIEKRRMSNFFMKIVLNILVFSLIIRVEESCRLYV